MAEAQLRPVHVFYEGAEDWVFANRLAAYLARRAVPARPISLSSLEPRQPVDPPLPVLVVVISDPPLGSLLGLLDEPEPKILVLLDGAFVRRPSVPTYSLDRDGPLEEVGVAIQRLSRDEPPESIPLTASVKRARDNVSEPVSADLLVAYLLQGHPDTRRREAADAEVLKAKPAGAGLRWVGDWIDSVLRLLDPNQAKVLHARLLAVGLALVDPPLGRWMTETGLLQEIEGEIEEPVRLLLNSRGRELRDALEGSVLAGYAPDSVTGTDLLGIDADVAALSAVLATRSNAPPLSVGLFGRWGTGKSFFMARMRDRIEGLGREDPETYCSNVVQITFNAWHYIDANLWASLVARIFEELANHGRDGAAADREATENLLENLRISEAALAQARRAEREAREHKEEVEREVDGLAERRGREQSELASLSAGQITATVAESEGVRTELSSLSEALGVDASAAEAAALWHARLRGLWGRIVAAWWYLRARPGRIALAVLAIALGVAAGAAIAVAGSSSIATAAVAVLPVLAAIATVVVAIARVAAPVARFLNSVDAARQARAIELNLQMGELEAQLEQRREERRRAEAAERAAREALEEASSGTVLRRFVEERAASDHYARHLGVIGSVQRDFERLSDLMSRREPGDVPRDEQGRELPPIDRIVLYVDDLDRCPTRLVVEVLQAVHLLLAFPLFVVVVGVDPRWLTTSLERHHAALMASASDQPPATGGSDWSSTPREYLEKIFQIPYRLRPMEPAGYARLIRDLIPARAAAAAPAAGAPAGEDAAPAAPAEGDGDIAPAAEPAEAPVRRPVRIAPRSLVIEPAELELLEAVGPLIETPRAAKRLVNIYRFIRAGVPAAELDAFVGGDGDDGEFRAVLLMLTTMTAWPDRAEDVLDALTTVRPLETWREAAAYEWPDRIAATITAFDRFDPTLMSPDYPLKHFRDWRPRVERFSFGA
jgi:hypothetical protein